MNILFFIYFQFLAFSPCFFESYLALTPARVNSIEIDFLQFRRYFCKLPKVEKHSSPAIRPPYNESHSLSGQKDWLDNKTKYVESLSLSGQNDLLHSNTKYVCT